MYYKLILADFDNTLYCEKNKLSPTVAAAIREYQAMGGKFALCTGRMLASILPYAKKMGLAGDVAACQGSVIYSLDTDEMILNGGLTHDLAFKILEYIEERYTHIHLYIDGLLYVNIYDEVTKGYENYCGIKAHTTGMPASEFVKKRGGFVEKLLVFNKPEDNDDCLNDLEKTFGDIAVISTSGPTLVEIADLNFSKGQALIFLAQKYGIPIEQTIAIGDSLNDMTMITAAGKGIAVANAYDSLKAAADEVTISCSEGAVEQIIRKYGLGENL